MIEVRPRNCRAALVGARDDETAVLDRGARGVPALAGGGAGGARGQVGGGGVAAAAWHAEDGTHTDRWYVQGGQPLGTGEGRADPDRPGRLRLATQRDAVRRPDEDDQPRCRPTAR